MSTGPQKAVDGVEDSDGKVAVLRRILEDKATSKSDRVAAILCLGQLPTPASARILIDNIEVVYRSKNRSALDQIAVRALASLGDVAVEPILQFVESHADDKTEYRQQVGSAVTALLHIEEYPGGKEQPDGFNQFYQQNESHWTPQVRRIIRRDATK